VHRPLSRLVHSRTGRCSAVRGSAGRVADVTNGADAADAADRTGQWRVRHLAGWRAGIVFNASADLLVAWQSASLTTPARAWTATDRQFGPLLDHVRRTRLDND